MFAQSEYQRTIDRPLTARNLRCRRSAVITVELLLTLPILLIFLAAVIEFGLIFAVNQKVAYASRFGAKLASEEARTGLDDLNLSSGGSRLRTAVNRYLSTSEITTGACTVILEHNACLANPTQTDTDGSGCNCGAPATALPAGPPPAGISEYVRVTVCVPLTGNVPEFLSSLGFSIAGYSIEHSTLFRYEPNNSVPTAVIGIPVQGLPGGFTATPDITSAAQLSPPTTTLIINAPNATATNATFTLNFDANNSTDVEDAFGSLAFAWSTTAASVGATTGTTFTASFTVPGTTGGAFAIDTRTVTLAVTDTCGGTGTRILSVRINRLPP
ncbi:MAG: TadE/TadG family type IV pilus assembly protein [Planctomycetota bacterium]|nr:TadE/TadG family type IV pilus assembly protein [Planctomycetota bacterium]MDA1163187.1 TadE/TadG family type IV pilus assembly protein [Planctomycetota bacterium]